MKLEIIKKQEIVNDIPQEIKYCIKLDREYKVTWRTPINLIYAELYIDELRAIKNEFERLLSL